MTLPLVPDSKLPRDNEHPDRGCHLSKSCLNCHLDFCRYDAPPHSKTRRNRIMYREFEAGASFESLEEKYELSPRRIRLIITRACNGQYDNDKRLAGRGQLITLDELDKRSVVKPRKPWPTLAP